jgi:uncharacterized iron-regulated membrane protein
MSTGWLHRPQQVGLRRVLFQVHLWIALVLGLYVVMISLSGSAVVFRREFHRWLAPRNFASATATDHSFPLSLRLVEWLVHLHDDLLAGSTGRMINGIGALLVLVVLLTGAVLWWPGKTRWWQGMVLSGPVNSLRFARQLHNFIGFWCFALLLMWALTAVYFAFPQPFEGMIDFFDANPDDADRPGEQLLYNSVSLHFGRFGGWQIRLLWVVLGLLPAVLFITGFLTWWKRQRRGAARPQNFTRTPA